ncbi:MAG TPA: lysophospholipase [Aldersonia sp.]
MTETTHGGFVGAQGEMIRWQSWLPDATPSAVVVIVHGFAEHAGRYRWVGEQLAAAGYATYAADNRGHGQSDGPRGNIGRIDAAADDLGSMLAEASTRHAGAPRFVLGHSLGGLVTLHYITRRPVELAGVVLSAPLADASGAPKVLQILAPLVARVAPNLGTLPVPSDTVSRDPAIVHDYETDPLNFHGGKLPAQSGAEVMKTIGQVYQRIGELRLPLLVLHGTADKLVPSIASKSIAEQAGSPDLTLKLYDGLYHEILNEPERDEVIGDILAWLDKHR